MDEDGFWIDRGWRDIEDILSAAESDPIEDLEIKPPVASDLIIAYIRRKGPQRLEQLDAYLRSIGRKERACDHVLGLRRMPNGTYTAKLQTREWIIQFLKEHGETAREEILDVAVAQGYVKSTIMSEKCLVDLQVTVLADDREAWALAGQPVTGSPKNPNVRDCVIDYLTAHGEVPQLELIKHVSKITRRSEPAIRQELNRTKGVYKRKISQHAHWSLEKKPDEFHRAPPRRRTRPSTSRIRSIQVLKFLQELLVEPKTSKEVYAAALDAGWSNDSIWRVRRENEDLFLVTNIPGVGNVWSLR